jgi:phosphoheptose isomerase
VSGYARIAESFHRRIETITGAVDAMAPGIEGAATVLTQAALEDRRIFLVGADSDAALADFVAHSLRSGEPPLPALSLGCSEALDDRLWRDLRTLARDGDVLLCIDTLAGAPLTASGAEFAATRNLRLVTLSDREDTGAPAVITLQAATRDLRRELLLMACHCLQVEIRHLLLGE